MKLTAKIQKAIIKATELHYGQKRKGDELPYIIHPYSTAFILANYTNNEDVIVAGLLHDVLEDSHGRFTFDDIKREFGREVSKIIENVSEKDKSLPWEERKRMALEKIKEMDRDSLLVKSADILHNMTDLISDLERKGDKVFESFNAPKEKQLKRYQNLIEELERVWPENPLLPELRENLLRLMKFK